MGMTEQELQQLVEQISLEAFGLPFIHRVKINSRMRTTGGRYHLDDHHLEINAHFLETKNQQYLPGIIKHELCHYHLHLCGQGYRHRDSEFKFLLAKVGGLRYAPEIGMTRRMKNKYHYRCQSCGQDYFRIRRVNTARFYCGKCHGRLKLV